MATPLNSVEGEISPLPSPGEVSFFSEAIKTQTKEWAPEAPNITSYLNEESIFMLLASHISLRAHNFIDTTI